MTQMKKRSLSPQSHIRFYAWPATRPGRPQGHSRAGRHAASSPRRARAIGSETADARKRRHTAGTASPASPEAGRSTHHTRCDLSASSFDNIFSKAEGYYEHAEHLQTLSPILAKRSRAITNKEEGRLRLSAVWLKPD